MFPLPTWTPVFGSYTELKTRERIGVCPITRTRNAPARDRNTHFRDLPHQDSACAAPLVGRSRPLSAGAQCVDASPSIIECPLKMCLPGYAGCVGCAGDLVLIR